MHRKFKRLQFAALFILSSPAFGQGINGSLTGLVTDTSGAAIVNAAVRAKNMETGVVTAAVTNHSGGYNVASVAIGTYEVTVESSGFKRFVKTGILVETAQTVRTDAVLEVGAAREIVTVQAEAPLLQSETSAVGTEVSANMVKELPYQLSGAQRNPFAFIGLTPGASGTSNAADGAIIAGGRMYASEVFFDGVPASYSARQNVASLTAPSVEVVAEFRIESVLPPAEYGRTSGGVVLAASRSGTNALHGSVFTLFRNGILDARRYNAAAADITRQGEFGGSLGGPVMLPKLYDGRNRTFFFVNYTGFRRESEVQGQTATVPTVKMRAGDFSEGTQRIYDPSSSAAGGTRIQFPNNTIPASLISPFAQKLSSIYPLPNAPGLASNLRASNPTTNNTDAPFVKIDHAISDSHRLSGSFRNLTGNTLSSQGILPPVSDAQNQANKVSNVTMSDNLILKSNLVNSVQLGYNRFLSALTTAGDIGVKVPGAFEGGFPGVIFSGQGLAPLGRGADRTPLFQNVSLQDSVSWTRGKHNFKFGGRYDWYLQDQTNPGFREGSYTFSQFGTSLPNVAGTGHSYASFLLGLVNNASMAYAIPTPVRSHYGGLYFQDDWKITRTFTLNYGLRWEAQPPFYEIEGRTSLMDPNVPNPGAGGYPGAVVFAGDGPGRIGGKRFMQPYWGGWGPRLGFAKQLSSKTVLRGGYGLFYQPLVQGDIRMSFVGWTSNIAITSPDGGVTPVFQIDQGWPAGVVKAPPFIDPTISNNQAVNMAELRPGGSGRLPRTQQWQFGIQQTVRNILLEATYVGTMGHGITNNALVNPNQLPVSDLSLGPLLTRSITDPQVVAAGYKPPYAGFTGTLAQSLRVFPQYQDVTVLDAPTGNSTYHGLLFKSEKRFANGLQFLVSYAFSKQISDVNINLDTDLAKPQDQYNRRLEKALGNDDLRHRFTMSYSYQLPFGKGKPFLKQGVLAAVVGGWSVSAIQSYNSGGVLQVTIPNNLPIFSGSLRPNLVAGVPVRVGPGRDAFQPLNASTGQTGDAYLNRNAFAVPAPFTLGTLGPFLPDVQGFGTRREDISVFRRLNLWEKSRMELRANFFNAFNHRNLNNPVTDLTNPNFGRITGQGDPRSIQLGFRVEW